MLQSSTQPWDGSVKGPVIAVVFGGLAGPAMTLQSLLTISSFPVNLCGLKTHGESLMLVPNLSSLEEALCLGTVEARQAW